MATFFGGSGDESATGTAGKDTLVGGGGNDSLYGLGDRDSLSGGDGNDQLFGGDDRDILYGGADDDQIYGAAGRDTLYGGSGNDTLDSGLGNESVFGGDGADRILLTDAFGDDTVSGDDLDSATDTLDASGLTSGVTVTVTSAEAGNLFITSASANNAAFTGIEAFVLTGSADSFTAATAGASVVVDAGAGNDTVIGSAVNDTISGGLGSDSLQAGAGNDLLDGGADADTLDGGDNDDLLTGGAGADSLVGGLGTDTADYSLSGAGVTVTLGGGPGSGGDAQGDVLSGIENLTGSASADSLTGDGLANVLTGGGGADTLTGGIGTDQLFGGTGNDLLDGGADADTLDGGDNDDLLRGGAGADSLVGGLGTDTADYSLSGAGVTVTLGGGPGSGGDAQGDVLSGIENLIGSSSADSLTGDGLANVLTGGDGDDLLTGGAGADSLVGGIGTDTADYSLSGAGVTVDLSGGPGSGGDAQGDVLSGIENLTGSALADSLTGDGLANVLTGGDGDDQLTGGAGDDSLTGGLGADSLFGGDGQDYITGGSIGDSVDGDEGGVDLDTLDLVGAGPFRIIPDPLDPLNTERGIVQFLDPLTRVVVGEMTFRNIEQIVPCFTPGTLIRTERGLVPVEALTVGDLVVTRDHGLQPLRWIGVRDLSLEDLTAQPKLQPVRIGAGALGGGLPRRAMIVSPQHRMLIEGPRAEMLFGEAQVLVAATHLRGLPQVKVMAAKEVRYIHLLFDAHELIEAEGAWTESFQPAMRTLGGMDAEQREELAALFPDMTQRFATARLTLKGYEARVLLVA